MSTVAQLIEQLKSPNKDRRYDGCEELRVMESVAAEALVALEAVTHDPDPYVREVAQNAVQVHSMPGSTVPGIESAQTPSDSGGSVLVILLGGVAAAATSWAILWLAFTADSTGVASKFGDGLGFFVCTNMLLPPGAFVAGLIGSLIALRRGHSNGAMVLVGLAIGAVLGLVPLLL